MKNKNIGIADIIPEIKEKLQNESVGIEGILPVNKYIPIYHSNSNINGIGVFTPMDLKEGEVIGASHVYYDGYWYMTTHGNYNHSYDSNCKIVTKGNLNLLVAKFDIKRNSELTVNYKEQSYLEQPGDDWV